MLNSLSHSSKFDQVSNLLRGNFFVTPEYALALAAQLANLITGDGLLMQSPEQGAERSKLPVQAISYNKDTYASFDEAPKGSVAVIPLKGHMWKYGTWYIYGTVEISAMIIAAALHPNITAIVIDIDSGGGGVDSIAPIVQAIEFARFQHNKPVVASVDTACSAALWAASACDQIIIDNDISSTLGSVGVMMSFWDITGYYESLGFKLHTIYAKESGDKNLAFEKALKGEYDLIKTEELSPLAISFQNAMKTNRAGKLDLSEKGLLSGKTYYGQRAVDVGFADAVGTRETATQRALDLVTTRNFLSNSK